MRCSQPGLVSPDAGSGIPAGMGARVAMTAAVAATLVLSRRAGGLPGARRPDRVHARGGLEAWPALPRPPGRQRAPADHPPPPRRRRRLVVARRPADPVHSTPRRGGVQVFVKRLGGGVRQLTRGRDTYAYPAWSPSGKRIVAVRGHMARDGFQYESVVTMRADGSRKRAIYSGGRLSTSYPAWSPDGKSIAFVHTDIGGTGADPSVYVVPAAGGAASAGHRPRLAGPTGLVARRAPDRVRVREHPRPRGDPCHPA